MQRLVFAFLAAPLIWAVVGTMIGFVIAGMTEPNLDGTIDSTLNTMAVSFGFFYAFTLTLGVLGVLVLLYLKQRSAAIWALTGGAMGGVVATINTILLPGQLNQIVLIFFVAVGWAMFLTIRWLAKIKTS
ncbi:hypothetical protein KHP62_18230 [Rhodobacteraceae bacterium NNCM2]|nr:hypothetical protein [Coraliihabitans acroporae]